MKAFENNGWGFIGLASDIVDATYSMKLFHRSERVKVIRHRIGRYAETDSDREQLTHYTAKFVAARERARRG